MTIKEAAARLGKAELTIRRMVKSGKLPARLEDRPPWGPTHVIEDIDLAAVMEPTPPLIRFSRTKWDPIIRSPNSR